MSTHTEVGHGHGHHNEYLAHHFEDLEQQEGAFALGIWQFLATEVMFFGGLFAAYVYYHTKFHEVFVAASNVLNWKLGLTNTVVLLISSFTMASAVNAAQTGKQKRLVWSLVLTLLCGFAFMGIKTIEYTEKINHHLVPGDNFLFPAMPAEAHHAQLFYLLYFMMTGLHGVHVVGGLVVIAWILWDSMRGKFGPRNYARVEITGLYWHFVDLVWIYLFPILYLADRAAGNAQHLPH